jgi:hypothetical protein
MYKTVPVPLLMQLGTESMLGMVPGIDTSLLEVWFDSETGFQGL